MWWTLCEGLAFLLLECFCFEWHFLSPQNDCMETWGKIICASSNTAHHNKMLMALGQVSVSIILFKRTSNCSCVWNNRSWETSCNEQWKELYSQSFRELLQFLRKGKMVDTHMEDLRAKITLAKSGFPEDSDCSADGDSDPSLCVKTSGIAGSQDAFGNRKGAGQHIWKSWILMIGFC